MRLEPEGPVKGFSGLDLAPLSGTPSAELFGR